MSVESVFHAKRPKFIVEIEPDKSAPRSYRNEGDHRRILDARVLDHCQRAVCSMCSGYCVPPHLYARSGILKRLQPSNALSALLRNSSPDGIAQSKASDERTCQKGIDHVCQPLSHESKTPRPPFWGNASPGRLPLRAGSSASYLATLKLVSMLGGNKV